VEPEIAFGKVLRELRKGRNLSQEALALESGVERNYVSLLELGRNSASVKMIFKLAPALGISVTDFMGMVEAKANERLAPKVRRKTGTT
jgi:transcriptional regulator with XRE-family HTH domain